MCELKTILKFFIISDKCGQSQNIREFFCILEDSNINNSDVINYIENIFNDYELKSILHLINFLFKGKEISIGNNLDKHPNYNQLFNFIIAEQYFHQSKFDKVIEKLSAIDIENSNHNIYVSHEIITLRLIQSYISSFNNNIALKIGLEYLKKYPGSKLISNILTRVIKVKKEIVPKPKISLCMIVKNEEHYLPGCLESVKDIVSEMVIVDTGSTDRTIEIANMFNAKVYHFPWINDFAAARNESLKYAIGEWLLYMDADERLILKDKDYIFKVINSIPEKIGAVLCILESLHSKNDGKSEMHRGAYPRLFRNYGYPNIKFIGKIHEQISPSIRQLGKEFVDSEIVIEHLGYNRDLEIITQKVKRNYELLLEQVKEEPLNGYAWFQLGQTLGRMNLQNQAIEALEFALETNSLSGPLKASAYATLSQLVGNNGQIDKCLIYAERSLSIAPNQQYARHLKAFALLHLRRFEESEREFLEVLKLKNQKQEFTASGFDVEIPTDLIFKGIKLAKEKVLQT